MKWRKFVNKTGEEVGELEVRIGSEKKKEVGEEGSGRGRKERKEVQKKPVANYCLGTGVSKPRFVAVTGRTSVVGINIVCRRGERVPAVI